MNSRRDAVNKVEIRVKTVNIAEIEKERRPCTRRSQKFLDGMKTTKGGCQLPSGDRERGG